ncbi:TetR/AcrR family transcriptional regulator [Nocardia jinanensis]|uniref:TetR family transcriptional regulator n=1 Tax=Nocardia jinanensis TaxID=382504 RepID=A0A917VY95_9NOCA|nr:TetR family transcriptional regulator [Nocardia jinanensis]GGL43874.1 TetR family transcriptional regulator [Nocardia jinanensis]
MTAADSDGARPARSGRRPGQSGTREAILAAARERFAQVGFDKTSIRAVAADAEVDPALVHHYFGTKQQLFAAVVELPVDPEVVLRQVDAVPLDRLGETIVAAVVGLWDSPAGAGAVALVRSMVANGDTSLARDFLLSVVLERVRQRIATDTDDGRLRVALAASQMAGLVISRKILDLRPVSGLPLPQIVAAVGPTVQRYLTGDLGQDSPGAGEP